MKMVSMGVKEIFPLIKCDNIFDLMFPSTLRCPNSLLFFSSVFYAFASNVDVCTCILHLGILTLEKKMFYSK
jgi:hypothetical protein